MSITSDSSENKRELPVLPVSTPAQWYAYLVPLEGLPLKSQKRPQLLESVQKLIHILRREHSLDRSVWLQLDELHKDNAILNISRYARQWNPEMGLGIRPEAPPPRYWTEADLMERDHDSPLPALMHSIMLLDSDDAGTKHACETMLGTGGLIQVLHTVSSEHLREAWYSVFQPTIEEEGLAAYPVYAPLLGAASLTDRSPDDLNRWMADAKIYLRESVEDNGLFVLSRYPLDSAWIAAGFQTPAP